MTWRVKRTSIGGGPRLVVHHVHDVGGARQVTELHTPDVPHRVAIDRKISSKRTDTSVVRLANGAEVLLPGANGPEAFGAYVRRIARTNTFPEQRGALKKLAAISTSPTQIDDRTIVGVVTSEPEHLLMEPDGAVAKVFEVIEAMGCRPVIIPPRADLAIAAPHERIQDVVSSLVERLDGVIGLGGDDVHPHLYRARHHGALNTNLPRDKFEAAFIGAALHARVFMLGICRSHQLWNIVAGGEVAQDVQAAGLASTTRDQRELAIPMSKPFVTNGYENNVHAATGSMLGAMIGRHKFTANSAHHQAVVRTGHGFTEVAHTVDPDLGVKMIVGTESDRAITVQFHPEFRESGAPERKLLEGVCRRASIFTIVRQLEARGMRPTPDEVIEAMRGRPFEVSDFQWVREELAQIVARTKSAAA